MTELEVQRLGEKIEYIKECNYIALQQTYSASCLTNGLCRIQDSAQLEKAIGAHWLEALDDFMGGMSITAI